MLNLNLNSNITRRLQGGASSVSYPLSFSGSTNLTPDTYALSAVAEDIRQTQVFNVDANTKRCIYMVGVNSPAPGSRRGIKYSDAARGGENWSAVPNDTSFIFQSDTGEDWANIDGMKLALDENYYLQTNDDGEWVGAVGDFAGCKLYIVKRDSSLGWGAFTMIGAVLDLTGSNKFIRHIARPIKDPSTGRWWVYYQTNLGTYQSTNHTIGRAYTDDDTLETGWTEDTSWSFDLSAKYSWLTGSNAPAWMPDAGYQPGGQFYLMGLTVGEHSGHWLMTAPSVASSFSAFTTVTEKNPLIPYYEVRGKWNSLGKQEPNLYIDTDRDDAFTYWVSYNYTASGLKLGISQMTVGAFDDSYPGSQQEEDFDNALDTTNDWTQTDSGGITATLANGELVLTCDGTQNTSETSILKHKIGIASLQREICFSCEIGSISSYSGGNFFVGLANSDFSNAIGFVNGSASGKIGLLIRRSGSNVYSQDVNRPLTTAGRRLYCRIAGPYAAFFKQTVNYFVGVTISGGSPLNDSYVNVNTWPSEDLYMTVRASNVSGTAATFLMNDFRVGDHGDVVLTPFRTGDKVQEAYDRFFANHPSITSGEQTKVNNFFTELESAGWLEFMDEMYPDFLATEAHALVSWKGRTQAITGTVTKITGGFSFGGGRIDAAIDLSVKIGAQGMKNYAVDVAQLFFRIGGITSQTGTRLWLSAQDGTRSTRVYTNGTNRLVTLNSAPSGTHRTISGLFSINTVVGVNRAGSQSSQVNMSIDGVDQSATNGVAVTAVPTSTNLWRGDVAAGGAAIAGEQVGALLVGARAQLGATFPTAAIKTAINNLLA